MDGYYLFFGYEELLFFSPFLRNSSVLANRASPFLIDISVSALIRYAVKATRAVPVRFYYPLPVTSMCLTQIFNRHRSIASPSRPPVAGIRANGAKERTIFAATPPPICKLNSFGVQKTAGIRQKSLYIVI